MSLKILHLVDERWDSGLTNYALQTADLLQKKGHDVWVGVAPGKKPEQLAHDRKLKTVPFSSLFSVFHLQRKMSFDVIHAHTGRTHTSSVLAKLLLGRSRSPVLIRQRADARSLTVNSLFRYIYKKTDAVIAASEHVKKDYLEHLGLKESKVTTVYPSVDADSTFMPATSLNVGILGRLDPVKGHTSFLEAASRVLSQNDDVKFIIAGKEAGLSAQLLINQAKELKIEKNVQFLGFVPSAQDFMRTCAVGVISSLGSEEVSRACLEWMSVGRPVVGTLVGSLPELIDPDETGYLVPPGDSEALAHSILSLINHPEEREKFGRKALELAKSRFSSERQTDEILAIYHKTLNG